MFSEIQVFKCFLCACAENDAGRKATGGTPQELAAKWLVIHIIINIQPLTRHGAGFTHNNIYLF